MKRIITIIVDDDGTGKHAICEGERFISGLSMDELVGRVCMLILDKDPSVIKCGLRTEADFLATARAMKSGPKWWDFHPLRHGGCDPRLGNPPVKSEGGAA